MSNQRANVKPESECQTREQMSNQRGNVKPESKCQTRERMSNFFGAQVSQETEDIHSDDTIVTVDEWQMSSGENDEEEKKTRSEKLSQQETKSCP